VTGGPERHWFDDAVVYEVPPALMGDADGDGHGDLRGVIKALPHIASLGATAVWLQPFYPSPWRDGGYDVTDHFGVDPRLGTLDDVTELIEAADRLGMRVIVDLVVQHTSVDHPWFREALRARDSPFRDRYIWADEPGPAPVKQIFPTVEDGVWAWSEEAGQYYRHTFYSHEPDLNMASPEVGAYVLDVARRWLDLGVAGLRVDAAPYIVADAAQADPREGGFWLVEELRQVVSGCRQDAVLIAESDVEPEDYADYFGASDRFTGVLNFWLNNHLFLALARQRAEPLARALAAQPRPPAGCSYAVWLRNHDELDLERLTEDERREVTAAFAPEERMRAFGRGIRRRLAPMLGHPHRLEMALSVLCALPGTPVLLYGDELGMGEDLDHEDRAAVRLPMPWEGPGSVAAQEGDPDSVLHAVRRLLRTRADLGPLHPERLEVLDAGHPAVLAMLVRGEGGSALMVANLSAVEAVPALPPDLTGEVLLAHPEDGRAAAQGALPAYGYRWLRVP
jgi:maltose alpha-D-glucosyltransferase/alpha-amylase